jgi:hypothetical protein
MRINEIKKKRKGIRINEIKKKKRNANKKYE